jgi:hypothetical protein
VLHPDTIRVYVNAAPVDAPPGATALDAVRLWNDSAADDVAAGRRAVTDSRGLPVAPETPLHGGAIFRLVAVRGRAADADAAE